MAATATATVVMMYNGTSWVGVGTAGFSANTAYYTSLAFAPDGTPYVAYEDAGNNFMATVMQYTGGSWQVVGTAGFSAGVAYYESLAFGPDGTPYLAYEDYSNSQKATVMQLANGGPSTTTGSATGITGSGATLNGTVNDNGLSTTIAFEYGTTTSYGTSSAASTPTGGTLSAGSGSTAALLAISGLTPGTTYHFRVDATGNGLTTNGSDTTFTTPPMPVVTFTAPTSSITYGTALGIAATATYNSSTAAGTFIYTATPSTGGSQTVTPSTVLTVDTYTLTASFTPADPSQYAPASNTMSLIVQKATPAITTAPMASQITYGQTLASSTLSGGVASVAGTFAWTAPATAPGAGTASYSVTCTPSDTTDYTTATATVSVLTNKATPTMTTPPTASAITYGQTLAASTLTGGVGSVAGTFAWTAPTTAPAAGTASYSVTFTPTDTTDYNTATANVSVLTNKAAPTITTQPTASAITYGQTLASSTLTGGVGSVAGSFAWAEPTTARGAGTASYSVTFSPTDAADYLSATTSVSVLTNPAAQTITFAQLASPMTYGSATTLSLSATGGASGSPVTFSAGGGPDTISGSTLTITGAGAVVITANQLGSTNYAAATAVMQTLNVNKASVTLGGPSTQPLPVLYGQPGTVPVSITGQYSGAGISTPSASVSYSVLNISGMTAASGTATIAAGAASVPLASTLPPGSYTVSVSYTGDSNYTPSAVPLSVSLQVG